MPRRHLGPALAALCAIAASASPAVAAHSGAGVAVKLDPGVRASSLGTGATPLIERADLAVLRRRAARRGQRVPKVGRWYAMPARSARHAARRARRLDRGPRREAVALIPPPPPATCRIPPPGGWPAAVPPALAPDLTPFQEQRAGLALDAGPGSDGAGISIGVVEYSWAPEHIELAPRGLAPTTMASPPAAWTAHGTAVLSLLGGAADGQGITGLVPAARLAPRSPFAADGTFSIAAATAAAAADLRPGDILLLEQQVWWSLPAPGNPGIVGPAEIDPATREVIALAVAAGVTVVEPAGNGKLIMTPTGSLIVDPQGGVDIGTLLDDADAPVVPPAGSPGHSGAIVVGAGASAATGGRELGRVGLSNHGVRVDLQGYGEGVVTAGYGGIGPAIAGRTYTACFDGTSSGSATVAAAAAAVQGAIRARGSAPLAPAEVLRRLRVSGRPQAEPAEGAIGPRPQVAAALAVPPPAGEEEPGAEEPVVEEPVAPDLPVSDAPSATG